MVRGRETSTGRVAIAIAIVVAGAVALVIGAGCVKRQTAGSSPITGTCEGACEHYTSCKRTDDPKMLRECVRDCTAIYTDDRGVEDTETLGLFERLDCEAAVSFVEGSTAQN
jgi:hypothetical protein